MDFLSEIISVKRLRVEAAKARVPIERMRELAQLQSGSRRFSSALRDRSRPNIIAEFKRRSPSKGPINSEADPAAMARVYESAGAAAISVLTEEDYFDGSLDDLRRVREASRLPMLCKDFIFDEYQVYESAAAGADALLLIVAALDDERLNSLRTIAEEELGIDALVEVHTKHELDRAIAAGARMIGVNNRDLHTFAVSVATSHALARAASKDTILVSESGLTPADVRELRNLGYSGFLVGEALMRASDPAKAIRDFIGEPEPLTPRSVFVKICGITNVEDAHTAVEAGADMLGFNFYRPSPRFIEPDAAREIIAAVRAETRSEQARVIMLGVFVNESVESVISIAERSGLDGIQLHGDETIEYCHELKQQAPQQFAIKVVRSNGAVDFPGLSRYAVDAFMLDAYDPKLRGGTGQTADWTLAREAARHLTRLFLAGGLSPENVCEAISAVRPYAVDACSALELSPGKKDYTRMKQFVAAVRAVKLPDEVSASQ
jgi:indole-3-glycerol phosphate synthase / phosphoribosylanthranilate isomerase